MRHDVSAADMIAMIGAGAIQTPRERPTRTSFHVRGESCPRAAWTPYGRPTWTSFRVRNESPSEGRLFGPQGRMRLTGVVGGRRGQVLRSGRNRPERRLSGFSRAVGARPSWRLYSPVTRIQSPIKEKTQKNAFLQNHRIH